MKHILLIVLIFIAKQSLAGSYTLEIRVIDGYTNQLIPNCDLLVTTEEGVEIEPSKFDEKGALIFEKLKARFLILKVDNLTDRFMERQFQYYNGRRQDDVYTIYLYPNADYEAEMMAIEDSIYGPVTYSFDEPKGEKVDSVPANAATYSLGTDGLLQFVMQNLMYPEECIDLNIQGKVELAFVVEPDGKVTHVTVLEGVDTLLDSEAKRLVRAMPNWSSASNEEGEIIRTRVKLPIVYSLN